MTHRTWSDGRCPDCRKAPKLGESGLLRCACAGKFHERMAAIKGPPADDDFLKANGFQLTGDILGNRYYMGSMNRLLWFSADGTWGANPRPKEGMGFEDYVRAATLEELVL